MKEKAMTQASMKHTSTKRGMLLLALLGLAATSALAQVNALPPTRHILVYGDAQARALPDRFKIELKFSVVDPKADVARAKVEAHVRDAVDKLKAASVPDGAIVATSLRIAPRNEYDQDLRKQLYKGIEVSRELTARFNDHAGLTRFLAALETSSEVQVSGVETELSTEPDLRKALRQEAIQSTRQKAAVIAKAYGVTLAGLYSVSDTAPDFQYGIVEGDWPVLRQWNPGSGTLDRIEVTGSRIARAPGESLTTGYVQFTDKIYAVFLLAD